MQPFMGLGNSLQTAQGGSGGVGGWVELGRTTLGSAQSSISVSSLADKRYYQVLVDMEQSVDSNYPLRFNADSGSNYSYRYRTDGGTEFSHTSQSGFNLRSTTANLPVFPNMYIANLAGKEKLIIEHDVKQFTAGSGNVPLRTEQVGKWANTSDAINQISIASGSGNLATGTEVVVLGWDPGDVHTTNFFEEIGTGTGTGIEDVTASASKKYNWIQGWVNPTSGSTSMNLRLGNGSLDSGSNYAHRYALNGAGDVTNSGDDNCILYGTGASTDIHLFFNIFFINNSANEKIIMTHNVYYDTSGAAAAPIRFEIAGKWDNTSAQANHAGIVFSDGNAASNSELRWWGSD